MTCANGKHVLQTFLHDDWIDSHIVFSDGSISERIYFLKYDILNQELNIRIGSSIFLVPKDRVQGFIFNEQLSGLPKREFVLLNQDNKPGQTIFEVLVSGDYSLLVHHHVERLRPNYVPALDAGNINEELIEKESLYFMDKTGKVSVIPKRKKAAYEFFGKYRNARQYLKKNKVNFKKMKQVEALVSIMNKKQPRKKS